MNSLNPPPPLDCEPSYSPLCFVQTFDEIIELASSGDMGNVCTMGKHMKSGPHGLYNHMADKRHMFCFGQAAGKGIG